MRFTVYDYLKLREFERKLPAKDFYEVDRNSALTAAIALATSGIKGDASFERTLIESQIVDRAFRMAYCNYVEFVTTTTTDQPVVYKDWRVTAKSIQESEES